MAEPNVVIDPITRIEGHLRIEAVVEGGVITDAWCVSTLFRGIENVVKGRRPEDAAYIAQRMCGVCPTSHSHGSAMSVEDATGTVIPNGARLVRNLLEAAEFLHSHILWFYTLAALDYVNPAKALAANIADTYALAQAAGTSTSDFGAVQARLKKLVDGGDLSIFSNGWWGINPLTDPEAADALYNPEMPAELHLIGVAHYLEALEMQAEAARVMALISGKFPHSMTSVAGGTAWVPTPDKLDDILYRLKRVAEWINAAMIPDTLAIAPFYVAALEFGGGCGNFLSWGVFNREDQVRESRYLPAGVLYAAEGLKVEQADYNKVKEYVDRSWYISETGLPPLEGQTEIITEWTDSTFDREGQYSWAKAPRYDGKAMEAGPLSRMLVAYLSADNESNAAVKSLVDGALAKLGITDPTKLVSLLGRIAARNLEAKFIADECLGWVTELAAYVKDGGADFWASYKADSGQGAGLWEAPRGALGHFINIKGGRIENYQVVTPGTWDLSPKDGDGQPGPMEAALIGTPIAEVERPINAARIVRSFDP
ncbi:MAG: nickel-dependent hydrogenase large subunit [Actinomycetes bacterium]|jgi:hydrogenase large subunit|nr:nickel-dependent hydrogenase large subunit [Actinomycetes bacterium]